MEQKEIHYDFAYGTWTIEKNNETESVGIKFTSMNKIFPRDIREDVEYFSNKCDRYEKSIFYKLYKMFGGK